MSLICKRFSLEKSKEETYCIFRAGRSISFSFDRQIEALYRVVVCFDNREFKHDVYGRRQTAKITSDFLFFSCNPYISHTEIEKCLLLFTVNTNILILLYRKLKTEGKSFIVAVCRLP